MLSLLTVFLCMFGIGTVYSQSEYPIYKAAEGSYYEVGYSIGSQAKRRIQGFIASYPPLTDLRHCLLTACAVDFRDLVNYNQAIWPQYFEELKGYADGAEVEEMDIWLLTFKFEVSAIMGLVLLPGGESIKSDILQCSDILLNKETFSGIGHNEDGWNGTLDYGYFAQYANQFFVFQYPGSVVGHAFGVNKYGVAVSMNSVNPSGSDAVTIQARGTYLVCRAVLDAKSVSDAVDIVKNYTNGAAIAYGASLNVGYMDENGQIVMANIEISKKDVSVEYYGADQAEAYGYHFNMYLRDNIQQVVDESSVHRLNRTQQLILQNGVTAEQDIENILGDTKDAQYPIYNSHTLATGIFDIGKQVLYVYEKCDPKICEPTFSFSFDSF